MDEIQELKAFRSEVGVPSEEARAAARSLLLRHAAVSRTTRWARLRPWRRVALAIALLGALVAAGTALGLADPILDLIRGKPAEPRVQERLAEWNESAESAPPEALVEHPGIDPARARGVFAVPTSIGPVALWIAPTTRNKDEYGDYCWHLGFLDDEGRYLWQFPIESCDPPKGPAFYAMIGWAERPVTRLASGGLKFLAPNARPVIQWVFGRVPEGVATVRLTFRSGTTRDVRVFDDPLDRFYFSEIPCSVNVIKAIVGLDRDGRPVARAAEDAIAGLGGPSRGCPPSGGSQD